MQPLVSSLSLPLLAGLFLGLAIVVGVTGTFMVKVADSLAERTRLGGTLMGAVFIGVSTSLSGIATSVTAAASGSPELAVSNTIGGIAVQTAFLAIADLAFRRVDVLGNSDTPSALYQGLLQIALLTIPPMALFLPHYSLYGISPVSPLLVVAYAAGLFVLRSVRAETITPQDDEVRWARDEAREQGGQHRHSLTALWLRFAVFAAITAAGGYGIGQSGIALVAKTGLSETAVGGLFTAVSTSMPELVTVLAAVRQRALALAVGDILGGNCFDVLFLALADIAYREGSIYATITGPADFLFALTIMLVVLVMLAMLRERGKASEEKPRRRGWSVESLLILGLYLGGAVALFGGG
ncbi:sodium:calcium antiporter [Caenispirillum salinarum]|uniref:sodium:calcium antiporter n=1 Tax=Caenispirillum salinarum TaxID=859058 RepID=UPI00384E2C5E